MLRTLFRKIFGLQMIYSQYGEDLIIESFIPAQREGFYIDIGANHPVKFNNTALFYRKGWHGINIEPNPSKRWMFKLLRSRDINLTVGVGKSKDTLDFFVFHPSTLSTFDKKAADEYIKMGHAVARREQVPVMPLRDILATHASGKTIDLMSIDTEGFDMQVLESNDWNVFAPRFIILETLEYRKLGSSKKLNDTYDPYLTRLGYTKVADTHINTIYERTN